MSSRKPSDVESEQENEGDSEGTKGTVDLKFIFTLE